MLGISLIAMLLLKFKQTNTCNCLYLTEVYTKMQFSFNSYTWNVNLVCFKHKTYFLLFKVTLAAKLSIVFFIFQRFS